MKSVKYREKLTVFTKRHNDHDASFWQQVFTSNKRKFNRLVSDGRQNIQRWRGKKLKHRCTDSTLPGGGGSGLVWGVISAHDCCAPTSIRLTKLLIRSNS